MTSYAPDKVLSAAWTRTGTDKSDPNKGVEFERGGPSYRNIANRLEAIRGVQSDVPWSQKIAGNLRKVLLGQESDARHVASFGHMTPEQTLPTIAAAMFLGEAGRNRRAFLVNKMLLDMMEAGITYGGRKKDSVAKNYTPRPFSETQSSGAIQATRVAKCRQP